MKRVLSGWERPPRKLRRCQTKLDNIALVPASELTSLAKWQRRARALPAGETLVVVPSDNYRLREVVRRIDLTLRKRGRHPYIAINGSSRKVRSTAQ